MTMKSSLQCWLPNIQCELKINVKYINKHKSYRKVSVEQSVVVLIILNDDLLTANIQFGAAAESPPQWYKLIEQLNKNLLNASLTEQTHINWVSNKHIHSQHKPPALLLLKHQPGFIKEITVSFRYDWRIWITLSLLICLLKLCNLNGCKIGIQLNYIKCQFRPKFFLSAAHL